MAPLEIAPFRTGQDAAVRALILGIQRHEFGLPITADDQPDLADIARAYRTGAGEFWVAGVAGAVVGTIALTELDGGRGALRKMFVAAAWRGHRHGVAARLLERLLGHARQGGLSTLLLGTTAKFVAAHRFYEKNGFVAIPADALPSDFPRTPVDTRFYRLNL